MNRPKIRQAAFDDAARLILATAVIVALATATADGLATRRACAGARNPALCQLSADAGQAPAVYLSREAGN